jgi:hypothetical protein
LLHGGHQRSRRGMTEFSTTATESLYQYVRHSTPCGESRPAIGGQFLKLSLPISRRIRSAPQILNPPHEVKCEMFHTWRGLFEVGIPISRTFGGVGGENQWRGSIQVRSCGKC